MDKTFDGGKCMPLKQTTLTLDARLVHITYFWLDIFEDKLFTGLAHISFTTNNL